MKIQLMQISNTQNLKPITPQLPRVYLHCFVDQTERETLRKTSTQIFTKGGGGCGNLRP